MCNRVALVSRIVLLLAVLYLTGCGGSSASPWVSLQAPLELVHSETVDGFTLSAPADGADPAVTAGLKLIVDRQGSQVLAQVVAGSLMEPRHLLFELYYDPSIYNPLVAQTTDALASPAQSMSLQILDTPGLVACGQIPAGTAGNPVSAGTVLAEVLFAIEPFPAEMARVAAAVPAHTQALSPLAWDEHNMQFQWYYANPGDFDQNGMVGISDMVPLARALDRSGPFPFTDALSLVDADDDGQVTLADLQAIRAHYNNFIKSYSLYCSESISDVPGQYDEVSALEPVATVMFSDAYGDPVMERRWLTYRPALVNTVAFYWVRPVAPGASGGSEEGTRSNLVVPGQVMETGGMANPNAGYNLPPAAQMTLLYTGTAAPLAVEFDARLSTDPDGEIITYEWDFDGDGLFDAYGNGPDAEYVYHQAGMYEPLLRVTDNGGAWAIYRAPVIEVTPAVIMNAPPLADLAATEVAGEAPLTVGLLGSGSIDTDGYIVRYEWDFDGDGTYDLDSGSNPTVLHEYVNTGVFETGLQVTDNRGDTATDSVAITIGAPPSPNVAPIARIVPDATAGDAPLAVNFDASTSSDPDGSIVKYFWDLDGDGGYETVTLEPLSGRIYTQAGIYDAGLLVEDDAGTIHGAHVSITVNYVANILPVADLVPSTTSGLTPLTVTFDAGGSADPDGSITRYDYDFDGDGIWNAYDAPAAVDWTYTAAGNYNVRLRVTDDVGAQDDATVTIVVNVPGNIAPVAALHAAPDTGLTPLHVVFDATLSHDPDGSIVRYDYDFNGDGVWEAYDAPAGVAWDYLIAGTFNAALRVTDDQGAQHVDTVVITPSAPVNDLPLAQMTATPTAGLAPLTVAFDATGSSDADGTIVRYDYDLNGDGIWDAYDAPDSISWTYTTAGAFDARLRVTDDQGGQDSNSVTVTVNISGNNPPIADLSADTTAGTAPLLVNFDATGSTDPEGPVARYDWDFDGDGNYEYYDGSPLTGWTYTGSGTFDARVRVTDSEGAQDAAIVSITVNVPGNNPPVADLIATPASGAVPLDVTLDASGSFDPDAGDSISSYEWDFNGDGNYDTVTFTPVYIYTYEAGGTFDATVRVKDSFGVADSTSEAVTVTVPGNTLPNASLVATPASGNIPLAVTFDASASSDPDPGDSIVSYEWDFDGDGSYDVVTFTPGYVYSYVVGGTFDAVVRVTDSNGATDTAIAGISANVPGNTPPTADLVATPNFGDAPMAVTLDASASMDPDIGDSIVSYEWDFDGDGLYDAFSLSNTYLTNYNSGGMYDAAVRVTDSHGSSDIAIATVTISVPGNNPPTASLTVTPAAGGVPLEVTLDASGSFDADAGDSIASYEWDFNGDGNFDALTYTSVYLYTYTTAGSFNATVRVKDTFGIPATASDTVDIFAGGNTAPTAALSGSPDNGPAPLAVTLDASASSDSDAGDYIASYEWDFEGDGYYDVVTYTPFYIHTYTQDGSFTATVRVRDSYRVADIATKNITVSMAGNAPPVAAISADPPSGYAPLQVGFDASGSVDGDGSIVQYEWDFNGDGSIDAYGTSAYASFTYPQYGVYSATVRVTDDAGATDTASTVVSLLGLGWTMFGHDMLHTRCSPVAGPQASDLRWSAATGAGINGSPSIGADGTVYVGSLDNYLYAFNHNGTIKWRYLTGGQVRSTPCIGPDETIYFGSFDNNLYALRADGSLKWFFTAANSIANSPVLGLDGTVYFGSYDKNLYALNADGTEKWRFISTASVVSSPAIGLDGTIYAGLGQYLYALNPDDGSWYWRYDAGSNIGSSPAIAADGTIYFGCDNGRLFALLPDGSYYWDQPLGGALASSPAIGPDASIYIGSPDGNIYAFDADGTLQWNFDTGDPITSSPVVDAGGNVYCGNQGGAIFARMPGNVALWEVFGLGSMVAASPAIGADGTLYIGTYDFNLYAFGP